MTAPARLAATTLSALGLSLCACNSSRATDARADSGSSDEPSWTMLLSDLDEALFSVWGRASDDVWLVGSDSGRGPLVLHYDGDDFERLNSGVRGDLWWVFGTSAAVWMSGADGLVLRHDGSSFEELSIPSAEIVYGIVPFADDDVWAVGGILQDGIGSIHHYDGSSWTRIEGLPRLTVESPLFKVWGRSSDDLWVVGFSGYVLHKDGEDWMQLEVPGGERLFTVHGNDDEALAVGGFPEGVVVRADAERVTRVGPDGAQQLNGVWLAESGMALACGVYGDLWERVDGTFRWVEDAPLTTLDYHGCFIDPRGGAWAVGGQIVAAPYGAGMIAHRAGSVPSEINEN